MVDALLPDPGSFRLAISDDLIIVRLLRSRSIMGGRNNSSLHLSAHISGSVQKVSRLNRKRTSDFGYLVSHIRHLSGLSILQILAQTLHGRGLPEVFGP